MITQQPYNERELIHRIAMGDEKAFAILVNRYSRRVFIHIMTFVKSYEVSEELAQDVFVKIWNNRIDLINIKSFPDYLFIISRNQLISYLRKKLPFIVETDHIDAVQEQTLPNTSLEMKELQQQINKGIDQLRPQQQKIFRLSREEGLTYRQIAEHLSITPETVKWHLAEALNNLRIYLHEYRNQPK